MAREKWVYIGFKFPTSEVCVLIGVRQTERCLMWWTPRRGKGETDDLEELLDVGHRTFKNILQERERSLPPSHVSKGHSLTWKFSFILLKLKLLGMTTTPRWMLKRNPIWAAVLLYFFPSEFKSSSFNKDGDDTFTLGKQNRYEARVHQSPYCCPQSLGHRQDTQVTRSEFLLV